MSQMRVLTTDQLFIDPDVQLEFAVKENHVVRKRGASRSRQV